MPGKPPSITYVLSRKDKRQLFFWAYYSYPLRGFIRSVSGPLLVVLGSMIVARTSGFYSAAGVVLLVFGVYYIFKPFLYFLTTRKKVTDSVETLTLDVPGNLLHLSSNGNVVDIPLENVRWVSRKKFGYTLQVVVDGRFTRIIVPQPRIRQGDLDAFITALTASIGAPK